MQIKWARLGWAELGWAGLGWAGLGWAWLGWAGLGLAWLGLAGLGLAGLSLAGLSWAVLGWAWLGWLGWARTAGSQRALVLCQLGFGRCFFNANKHLQSGTTPAKATEQIIKCINFTICVWALWAYAC